MPKEVTFHVNADNNNIINLDLDAGSAATVNITVRDSKNNPYSGGFMIYAKNRRYYNTSGSLTSGSGSVSGLLPGDYVLTTRGGLLSSVTYAFLYKEFSFSGTTAIEAVMEPESVITGKYTRNVDFARETLTAMANIHGSSLGGKEGAPICMVKVNGDGTFRLGELNSQFAYDVMLFTWTRGVQSVATAENIRVSGTIDISELLKPAIDVKASQWQMFSVPYVLPGELAEIKSFFKDFAENNIISVYRWDHALATYTSPLRIEPGNSYWVKSSMAMNVLLPDTAQRTPLDRPHSIKLQKGWNMLATPFDFPFETEMVVVKNGDTVKSFREAVTGTDRWLEPEKFMHNGTTGYVETKNVGPWKGFWWYAKADLELSLEPVYAFDTDKSNISPILPYFSPLVNGSYEKSGRDFLMRIKTVSSGAEDREAYIGTADTAEDGLCALDCRKAPVFKDYVSAAFPQGGELLGRDVKSPVTTFKTWQFDVDSDIDSDITVSWEMIRRAPALRYFLLDVQSGTKIEMSEGSTYAYHAYGQANNPSVRTFKAFAATPEYADMIMAEFGIKKTYAYPNPAVNNARIVANMKSINASGVLVKIYDVSGRLLVTAHMKTDNLVDYYYDWNLNDDKGRSTGSGVYIFRITAISYGNDKTEAQIKRIAVVR
ncbi:MAG TPA: hypothetical protein DC049_13820 [Spirochaetia bacterium]|nr:hypothetical protein [Spirochaetia bacterium]